MAKGDTKAGQNTLAEFVAVLEVVEKLASPVLADRPLLLRFVQDLVSTVRPISDWPPEKLIEAILREGEASRPSLTEAKEVGGVSISSMPLGRVEQLLRDSQAHPKRMFVRIAQERFGIPKGNLAKLSKVSLVRKLASHVRNERSHETIARLAGPAAHAPAGSHPMTPEMLDVISCIVAERPNGDALFRTQHDLPLQQGNLIWVELGGTVVHRSGTADDVMEQLGVSLLSLQGIGAIDIVEAYRVVVTDKGRLASKDVEPDRRSYFWMAR